MLQLTFRFDSSGRSAIAAFAPRMGNNENRSGGTSGPATSVIAKVKPKTKRPNLYRVLILNDDYTPMEFVVHVLEKFFQKDVEAATKIMLHVHHHGIGECGVFTYGDRRDQGDASNGFCSQAPTSPAVRDGKEVASREIRQNGNGFCIEIAMDRTGVRLSRGNGLLAVGAVRAVGAKIRKRVAGTGLLP